MKVKKAPPGRAEAKQVKGITNNTIISYNELFFSNNLILIINNNKEYKCPSPNKLKK